MTATPLNPAAPGRVVVYYQTNRVDGALVSPVELARRCRELTAIIVGAIHVNAEPGDITLNDDPADHPDNQAMWAELAAVQEQGVAVIGMLGGAAMGSFERLEPATFGTYYPPLRELIGTYRLDGIDLDVEEDMSVEGARHLVDALRADFGPDFIITLAPVATALSGGGNLSGFDYEELWATHGGQIDWMNTQFYCGWGVLDSTAEYDAIISRGVFPAAKVVAGTSTHPMHGKGFVEPAVLNKTVASLAAKYPDFGGMSSWEYFNSEPGGTAAPWEWAQAMGAAMEQGRTR
ncbi:hypothetical protein QO003_003221 [Arthrobacter silviterrae]|uniref:chitinase n=1 Tax=Arthrobacter silviterrae TaxID=2026658 RepID=A0ABX0DE69_9MICC|nr:glycosyl hydrolase family 18 protein [Arthrobacter silviterrae]MDQ0278918.1 hypothetical protein [Arthrobacter silviterrae]NGN84021.1 chitinase [Arthrobacter silviterrae]